MKRTEGEGRFTVCPKGRGFNQRRQEESRPLRTGVVHRYRRYQDGAPASTTGV